MEESHKLQEIFKICSKKKLEFELVKNIEMENYINIDRENKKVEINISNINDDNFNDLLDEKILELNQIFQN